MSNLKSEHITSFDIKFQYGRNHRRTNSPQRRHRRSCSRFKYFAVHFRHFSVLQDIPEEGLGWSTVDVFLGNTGRVRNTPALDKKVMVLFQWSHRDKIWSNCQWRLHFPDTRCLLRTERDLYRRSRFLLIELEGWSARSLLEVHCCCCWDLRLCSGRKRGVVAREIRDGFYGLCDAGSFISNHGIGKNSTSYVQKMLC